MYFQFPKMNNFDSHNNTPNAYPYLALHIALHKSQLMISTLTVVKVPR